MPTRVDEMSKENLFGMELREAVALKEGVICLIGTNL